MKNVNLNPAYFKYIFAAQILLCLFTISPAIQLHSQTLVNEVFKLTLNYPDTVEWQSQVLYGSNIITNGNTWHNAAQKTNIVTTKTDQGGSIVWQTEYNGTLSGFDYGAAVTVDGSGNVFVAGATHNTSSTTFDIVVIKYNSSGVQQWATLHNGTGSDMDIPSDILLLGTDIYVCAASVGTGSAQYDYLLLKLNSSGTIQWNARYNYTNLYDIPGHLATNGTQIVVSGASQSTATNWDYTSLKYNTSGTLLNTQRNTAAGYGFDRPTGLVTDASGNFYLTGYTYNGSNYDMRTIKLNDALSPQWTKTENAGADDGANSLTIDNSGNVYIAGYSENPSGGEQMKVIKYNNSGTKLWTKTLQNIDNTYKAQATKIKWDATSGLIATGYMQTPAATKQITTFKLNTSNGNIQWKRDYNNLAGSIDYPTGVEVSGNHIWITGQTTEDDTIRYITLKYETLDYPYNIVSDTSGKPIYVVKQMMITFKPENVDLDFVNDNQQQFANLINVVNTGTYNQLYPLIKGQGQFTPKVYKIYSRLTANDSLSITRLGDTIPIPKFWSSFIVTLNVDVDDVYDTLNNLFSIINYAHPNYLYELEFAPNDDDYFLQNSIFNGAASLEDINAEGAWDVEKGGTHVKVGVFDTGIYWKHEDFHVTPGDETYADSKVEGGWDYENEHAVSDDDNSLDNSDHHGTCVAGIIGAITDNGLGIAGIAGGDLITGDANSTGVQLFDMEVAREDYLPLIDDENPLFDTWYCANAITEGATYTPDGSYGYGLHVMNHSWGTGIVGQIIDWNFDAMSNAMSFAFKNHVIQVCAKGNEATGELHYPSDLSDSWILSVGGSGDDGEFYEGNAIDGGSNYGNNIDLMASYGFEGVTVFTTDNDATDGYTTFGGTSGSAPHVAGVTGLMLSHVNNHDAAPHFENLTQEDVEAILQLTADERSDDPCTTAPYDDHCGWGLLDAEEALEVIKKPNYKVLHICNEFNVTDDDYDGEIENLFVAEAGDFEGVSAGYYCADRYKITRTSTHTLSATSEILNYWILPSMSNVLYSDVTEIVTDDPAFTMTPPTLTSTTVEGYIYLLKRQNACLDIFPLINKWIPFDPNTTKAKFCYTLHIYDEFATEVDDLNNNASITIFPNPTTDYINITSEDFIAINDISIQITDITGKLLISNLEEKQSITNDYISIPVNHLPAGVYVLSLNYGSQLLTTKFVKL